MTRALLPAVLIASAISASAAFAEVTPRPGPHDNRVRIATWTEGQVYRVVTTLTRVTTVEFGEGETIRSIIAGDTVGFQFDGVPGGRAFAIKPAASGVATNITVYTNRRSYYFHVVEARETPHYVVQFRYPESRVQASRHPHLFGVGAHTDRVPSLCRRFNLVVGVVTNRKVFTSLEAVLVSVACGEHE